MTTKMQFWNRSTFLVITGASRGIGKNMAIKFSALVTSDSTLVLVARDLQNLEATKTQILATNPKLDVKIYSIDLGKPDSQEFHSLLKSSAAEKQYELYFLVHNAAYSIDNVPASETDNIQQWNEFETIFNMATMKPFWNRSTFLVITGASRGIGKGLAIKFSTLVTSDSTLVLLARSLEDLEATKTQILATNPNLDVKIYRVDLRKPDIKEFDTILRDSAMGKQYELHFLVHNAASVLTDVRASEMDIQQFKEYMSMNLYSVTALTSSFLKLFTHKERCILNISSSAAVHPLKGMVHYCVGKTSREMYFKVLAQENPDLNILNYAPGPIDTKLLRELAYDCWNEDTRTGMQRFAESPVKLDESIEKLIETLESRSYSNGEHVTFQNPLYATLYSR